MTSHSTSVIPDAREIRPSMHGPAEDRIRVVRIGPSCMDLALHIPDRATLDALTAALDAIRADMAEYPTP